MSFFDINSYTWYASLRGLSQSTIVPSLAISTLCVLGYVSSTSSALTMPEYCFAFFGYIDTLPLEIFASWATLPLGLASWAILPLGLLCLLGLPLGLFCRLGYYASWAILPFRILCFLGYLNMLPLGPCLIDIVCFDNAVLICLLGCANTGHLLVCKNDKLCSYAKPGYSVKPDMIRDMILVSFEIDVSIYHWARTDDNWIDL
jgi:hypothetical protein